VTLAINLLTEKEDAVSSLTEENGLGWMTGDEWRALHDLLVEHGALAKSIDITGAYADRFLKEIYIGGKLQWP